MVIAEIFTVTILWNVFAYVSGLVEAMFFHVRDHNKQFGMSFDVHVFLTLQRTPVLLFVGMLFLQQGVLVSLIVMIMLAAQFPFMHDGAYYTTRNSLDNTLYPKRWNDHSSESTAKLTKFLTARNRRILFLASPLLPLVMEYIPQLFNYIKSFI